MILLPCDGMTVSWFWVVGFALGEGSAAMAEGCCARRAVQARSDVRRRAVARLGIEAVCRGGADGPRKTSDRRL